MVWKPSPIAFQLQLPSSRPMMGKQNSAAADSVNASVSKIGAYHIRRVREAWFPGLIATTATEANCPTMSST